MTEDDVEESCPLCRGICNCKACLRIMNVKINSISEVIISKGFKYVFVLEFALKFSFHCI